MRKIVFIKPTFVKMHKQNNTIDLYCVQYAIKYTRIYREDMSQRLFLFVPKV